ncbi:hypothetical protein [Pyrococcus kukulkanii]|uniref:Uncharacterized protein n=1 Tax=Pyrococcus kukulkanii TaxID=1609559 RepID=A0A127B769_9EURY|nr:hypothetical protein [Pyrococcus kukulkanii]AMM53223.1 hypothetical protein TQ32_00965 [Pyrococcus kukulkanii]
MDWFRVHNILTFYLPVLIFVSLVYGFITKNSKMLIYSLGYLVAYFSIRLEIHHYQNKLSLHGDRRFVRALIVLDLFAVGFLLPMVLSYTNRANFIRNIILYLGVGVLIYAMAWKLIEKLTERRLLIISLGLSLVIGMTTGGILEPLIFALLALWTYLVVKHNLVPYAEKNNG